MKTFKESHKNQDKRMIKLTFEGYRNGTDFDSITIECKESNKQMWLDYYWDWKHVRDV